MSASVTGGIPLGAFDLTSMQTGSAAAGGAGGAPGGDGGDNKRGGDDKIGGMSESEGSECNEEEKKKKREGTGKMITPFTHPFKKSFLPLALLINLFRRCFDLLNLLSVMQFSSNYSLLLSISYSSNLLIAEQNYR